ncbi:hypothetical protein NKH77_51050 [Streptomyces sp. M19]
MRPAIAAISPSSTPSRSRPASPTPPSVCCPRSHSSVPCSSPPWRPGSPGASAWSAPFAVLVILLGGMAVRLVPSLPPLFLGTLFVGSAIAVANVVVPALIKRDFHQHVGLMSGLHTTMLVGGGALAAGSPSRCATVSGWTGRAAWRPGAYWSSRP